MVILGGLVFHVSEVPLYSRQEPSVCSCQDEPTSEFQGLLVLALLERGLTVSVACSSGDESKLG